MRLQMMLSRVGPQTMVPPTTCAYEDCEGTYFRLYQAVSKPVRDTVYEQVTAHRYKCLRCRRTFRVYLAGVTSAHVSLRVKGLAVMLYLLGLSYGATSILLEALEVYLSKVVCMMPFRPPPSRSRVSDSIKCFRQCGHPPWGVM